MNGTEYKKFHESYMHNNHESTPLHTFLCIFFTVQCVILTAITTTNNPRPGLFQYIAEYLLIILPLTAAHTILSDHIYLLNASVLVIVLYKLLNNSSILQVSKILARQNHFKSQVKSVTCLRSMTYIITVFCILAVDFKAFPRHLAKNERLGISLMDTGVGLFVLMSGLVHKDLRTNSLSRILVTNAKFISILLILGVARYVSVKQIDYQYNVTEYGVHWNFFFTLGICKLISTILLYITNRPLWLSIVAMILHEYFLDLGLRVWVFSEAERSNFVNANREGISSSLGYVSLYLFAAHIKKTLSDMSLTSLKLLFKFSAQALVFYLYLLIPKNFVSRVLANSAYCAYVMMILLIILSTLYLFEVIFQDKQATLIFKVPALLSAVNSNGLVYFLVANLLTGAINLAVRTLFVSTAVSFVILNVYMIATLSLVVFLEKMV